MRVAATFYILSQTGYYVNLSGQKIGIYMMSIENIRQMLADRNLAAVAKASGLSYKTVRKLAGPDCKRVSYQSVKRLSDYLEAKPE